MYADDTTLYGIKLSFLIVHALIIVIIVFALNEKKNYNLIFFQGGFYASGI